jgi:hypothetical protein
VKREWGVGGGDCRPAWSDGPNAPASRPGTSATVAPGTSAAARPGAVSGLALKPSASAGTEPERTGHTTPWPRDPGGPAACNRLSTAANRFCPLALEPPAISGWRSSQRYAPQCQEPRGQRPETGVRAPQAATSSRNGPPEIGVVSPSACGFPAVVDTGISGRRCGAAVRPVRIADLTPEWTHIGRWPGRSTVHAGRAVNRSLGRAITADLRRHSGPADTTGLS